MTAKSPPTRRKFISAGDEIDYLYHKVLFWFYGRENRRRALPFGERLEKLLQKEAPRPEGIFAEGCWSLVCELKGDLAGAIKHRENEIRLIKRLHQISLNTPDQDYVLKTYGFDDLSDRLDLLAILYHDAGDLDRAIRLLEESRQLCRTHRISFDGNDILKDYLAERKRVSGEGKARKRLPGRAKRSAG
jgi:hypothetical protein